MATNRHNYVSIFKIDGVPILPPLMTKEKRRLMNAYKEKAIQLEKARHQERFVEKNFISSEFSCNLLRHGHSHIPQPQTPRKQIAEASTSTVDSKRERLDKLRRTDTLVYDNKANSIILTLEGFEEETDFQSMMLERDHKKDQNENKISPDVNKSTAKEEPSHNSLKPQPYAAFIPIPSICVNPPTPCITNNPICSTTPSKRLCASPTLKLDTESGMIRSNSFTLDGPSNVLLEHIKNQKIKKSTATQDTIESKAKRVQKVEVKPKAKSPSSPSLNHFTNNTVLFKAKRSPYELKPSSKTKLARKHKSMKSVTPKKQSQNNGELSLNTNIQSTSNVDILKDIEEQHRARFLELVRQQQNEQKRLQEQFEKQQKLLLEQLSARMAKVHMQQPTSPISIDSAPCSIPPSPEKDSSVTRSTPRRCLFLDTNPTTELNPKRDPSPSPQSTTTARRLNEQRRLHLAATKINAFARGFLVRRLFKTYYVQQIVQTIKDTLIFVINLHRETINDSSESNIKLKARLLQQLTSATSTLYSIFIKATTKERMEIIARDRKYIQAKLLNSKKSPRIIR